MPFKVIEHSNHQDIFSNYDNFKFKKMIIATTKQLLLVISKINPLHNKVQKLNLK